MRTQILLAAILLAVPAVQGAEVDLNDQQKNTLSRNGVSDTSLLNGDTIGLISRGVADGSGKRAPVQDATAVKLQLPQIRADISLYNKLYDNPASAAQEGDLSATFKRLEKFLDPAAIERLRTKLASKTDPKDKKDDKDKKKDENKAAAPKAEPPATAGLRTANVPSPSSSASLEARLTNDEVQEEKSWWDNYYCRFYLAPMGIPCD